MSKYFYGLALSVMLLLFVNCLTSNDDEGKTGKVIDTIYNYDTMYLIDSTTFDSVMKIDTIWVDSPSFTLDTLYEIDTIDHGNTYIIKGMQLIYDTTNIIFKSEEYLASAFYLEGYFLFRDSLPADPLAFNTIEGLYYSVMEPYTRYYDPVISIEINKILTTASGGTGIYVDSVGSGYYVFDVVPGSPGALAGVLKSDTITSVNNKSTVGLSYDEMQSYLVGDVGTSNTYKIKRADSEISINVIMDEFLDRSVFVDSVNENIALITLTTFSASTFMSGGSAAEFKAALDQTKWAEWTVFDLRQNGGGRLDQCLSIASEFVDSGSVLMDVMEREYNDTTRLFETKEVRWYSEKGQNARNRKFYVLVDSHSASASEVVVASLVQHREDIKTIGEKTYGKGRGQLFIPTPEAGIARVTCMKMVPGKGVSYDAIGITPDIVIDDPEYALDTAIARILNERDISTRALKKRFNSRYLNKNYDKTGPLLYKVLNKIN